MQRPSAASSPSPRDPVPPARVAPARDADTGAWNGPGAGSDAPARRGAAGPGEGLATRGLGKRFARVRALNGLDMAVPRGTIHALAGPNGAGKTTLMRILLGILRPSEGEVSLLGLDPVRRGVPLRARVGYLPAEVRLPPRWLAREVLAFALRRYPDADPSRARELAAFFELPLGARVRTYSSGMRQRLGLVLVLSRSPEALILDEPTQYLDPVARGFVLDRLRERAREGALCLLSTHRLEEAEGLCEGVTFLDRGRAVSSQEVLRAREGLPLRLRATFRERVPRERLRLPEGIEARGDGLEWILESRGDPRPLLDAFLALRPVRLEVKEPGLEEIYRYLYASSSPPRRQP